MQIVSRLNEILAERHLLKHMWYQAWSKGELTIDQLQDYSAQYYNQVQSFPRFISRVHTACPEIEARKVLLENLVDEEIHGTDHPALWMQFANGMGTSRERVLNDMPLPETQFMVNKFYELAERDWRDGLCALYAYEYQVPEVSKSKIDGLKKHYGMTDPAHYQYFSVHIEADREHAAAERALLDHYVNGTNAEKVDRSVGRVLDALWDMLSGVCRRHAIAC